MATLTLVLLGAAFLLGVSAVVIAIDALRERSLVQLAVWVSLSAAAVGLVPAVSLGWTLATDPDPLLGSGANWVRNHHMGFVVDRVEQWRYKNPPSSEPAAQLNLAAEVTVPRFTRPVSTATSLPELPNVDIGGSTTTTAAPVIPFSPIDFAPVVEPALTNEGRWIPLTDRSVTVPMWVTAIRPLAEYPSVTATVVSIDTSTARFVLHNGTELPGGTWAAGPRLNLSADSGAIAAFNGGFRFEHIAGGYLTEGVEVRPLADGEAAIAINSQGELKIGVWGRDLTADGDWVSVRQSLRPIVDGGVNQARGTSQVQWGVDFGNVTYVFRSAICLKADGELLYAVAGDVDAVLMADVMISCGCELAMQLDINGNWPQFAVVSDVETGSPKVTLVDARMSNTGRYINGSKKDFIGIYHNPR
jgi:hypothetical protein